MSRKFWFSSFNTYSALQIFDEQIDLRSAKDGQNVSFFSSSALITVVLFIAF